MHRCALLPPWILHVLHRDGDVPSSSSPEPQQVLGCAGDQVMRVLGVGVNHSKSPSSHSHGEHPHGQLFRGSRSCSSPALTPGKRSGKFLRSPPRAALQLYQQSWCSPRVLQGKSPVGFRPPLHLPLGLQRVSCSGDLADRTLRWHRGLSQPGNSRDPEPTGLCHSHHQHIWQAERKSLCKTAPGGFSSKGERGAGAG